jgi:hypothetical protein
MYVYCVYNHTHTYICVCIHTHTHTQMPRAHNTYIYVYTPPPHTHTHTPCGPYIHICAQGMKQILHKGIKCVFRYEKGVFLKNSDFSYLYGSISYLFGYEKNRCFFLMGARPRYRPSRHRDPPPRPAHTTTGWWQDRRPVVSKRPLHSLAAAKMSPHIRIGPEPVLAAHAGPRPQRAAAVRPERIQPRIRNGIFQ